MTTSLIPLTGASFTTALRAALRPGMTVALGDGVGSLRCLDDGGSVGAALSAGVSSPRFHRRSRGRTPWAATHSSISRVD